MAVKLPEYQPASPKFLTKPQLQDLLDAPDTDTTLGLRDKAILEIFCSTGMNVEELRLLDVDDVDLTKNRIRAKRKQGRLNDLPLTSSATLALQAYLPHRYHLVKSKRTQALFPSLLGTRIKDSKTIQRRIEKYQKQLGIDYEITSRILRHSYAVHILHTSDYKTVQQMLGYSSPGVAYKYSKALMLDDSSPVIYWNTSSTSWCCSYCHRETNTMDLHADGSTTLEWVDPDEMSCKEWTFENARLICQCGQIINDDYFKLERKDNGWKVILDPTQ